jgi:IS1 family transposase
MLFEIYKPNSVLDVGAGLGTWLKVCIDLGVSEVLGIDGEIKNGYSSIADRQVQRYRCQSCKKSFQLDYTNPAYKSDTADKIVAMTLNGSGVRDIRRVLGVGFKTIQNTLKKKNKLHTVNPNLSKIEPIAIEIDEQWSYTGHKRRQCWTIYAIEKESRQVVAFVCGRRTKKNVIKLLKLLKSFNITCFYTDGWKVYGKLLPKDRHIASKKGTQRVERNNLNFRTRLKRMTRKTICFSKNLAMHKLVIALFINFCSFC